MARKYLKRSCPICGSKNLTPVSKRSKGKRSYCKYICENCGYETDELLYAIG